MATTADFQLLDSTNEDYPYTPTAPKGPSSTDRNAKEQAPKCVGPLQAIPEAVGLGLFCRFRWLGLRARNRDRAVTCSWRNISIAPKMEAPRCATLHLPSCDAPPRCYTHEADRSPWLREEPDGAQAQRHEGHMHNGPPPPIRHWTLIAEELTRETDSNRLLELARELADALDRERLNPPAAPRPQADRRIATNPESNSTD